MTFSFPSFPPGLGPERGFQAFCPALYKRPAGPAGPIAPAPPREGVSGVLRFACLCAADQGAASAIRCDAIYDRSWSSLVRQLCAPPCMAHPYMTHPYMIHPSSGTAAVSTTRTGHLARCRLTGRKSAGSRRFRSSGTTRSAQATTRSRRRSSTRATGWVQRR